MPYSGTGIFTRVYQWVNDAANNIDVDATRTDTDSNDIASGLTNCITRDGQSPALAAIPMGGQKITGLAAGSADTDAVNYGQVFVAPSFSGGITFSGGAVGTGVINFAGSTSVSVPTLAPGNNSTNAASTAFATALAFAAALPAQAGQSGKFVTTNGATASWGLPLPVQTSNSGKILTTDGTNASWSTPAGVIGYLKVSDQKASGTSGGTNVAADITQERTLNTVETNTISGASLASNAVTLPAGTYKVRIRAPAANGANNHKAFLYNTTDLAYTLVGSSSAAVAGTNIDSNLTGLITIAATKVFKIRHYTTTAAGVGGLGMATTTGQIEVYTEVEFEKVG